MLYWVFLTNRDAPLCCTATDCLVKYIFYVMRTLVHIRGLRLSLFAGTAPGSNYFFYQ